MDHTALCFVTLKADLGCNRERRHAPAAYITSQHSQSVACRTFLFKTTRQQDNNTSPGAAADQPHFAGIATHHREHHHLKCWLARIALARTSLVSRKRPPIEHSICVSARYITPHASQAAIRPRQRLPPASEEVKMRMRVCH